jgi:hypothetical protein
MNGKTRRTIMWAVVLLVLLCAAGGAALYRLGNNTGLVDFKANQPAIPASEVSDSKPEEVAATLVGRWLSKFKTGEVSWASRLEDYEIKRIDVARSRDNLVVSATFSVKPTRWSYNNWQAGGGTAEGDWIRSKSTRFAVTKTDGSYKLQELGPGPL